MGLQVYMNWRCGGEKTKKNPIHHMTKLNRELKRIEIGNAGSKRVPVLMMGISKTRSGRRFRPKAEAPLPAQESSSDEDTEESHDYLEELLAPLALYSLSNTNLYWA